MEEHEIKQLQQVQQEVSILLKRVNTIEERISQQDGAHKRLVGKVDDLENRIKQLEKEVQG